MPWTAEADAPAIAVDVPFVLAELSVKSRGDRRTIFEDLYE